MPTIDEYYVFEAPDRTCPVWCEMFVAGSHYGAPTPYSTVKQALTELANLHPGAVVDSLCEPADITEAIAFVRAGGGL